eukprot:CAMPEP_0181206914 /NCGR_PEP_ID=MMETSP1096-20121128/21291_1 /TAXON_ID=156174 ORGANISM="Chrysochromulina ericina, Strain CCMP281" /NCGR_SAMPLE_ID=MMETSP1096 /ASSEMBLY_ACC=CAM_ASM_000453 /LENGTH=125 /DNA_ID=CAMNT_0023297849 /DNA_START=152 /DNA_END=530 /DNA_ORIENTATION=-
MSMRDEMRPNSAAFDAQTARGAAFASMGHTLRHARTVPLLMPADSPRCSVCMGHTHIGSSHANDRFPPHTCAQRHAQREQEHSTQPNSGPSHLHAVLPWLSVLIALVDELEREREFEDAGDSEDD